MIRFEHVTKLYPGNSKPALNGTDVEIKAGEFVFLVGASGSGKSSFLRLVLKEDKPTSGEIHVLGQKLSAVSNRKIPYFRRSLGVVFQDFRLLPGRTVYQNVAFTLQVLGKSRGYIQEAVPDVLKMVGLDGKAERLPHELSGGEQQRVAIARAVVNKPAILLADEPTGNLDPTTSAGIMQVLELINAGGTTVVMATHDVGIVDSMKRRVIELIGGDIVRDEVEGGYTTSIPVQQGADAPASSTTAGATAFAAALAQDATVDLPSSPHPVVETTSQVQDVPVAQPVALSEQPMAPVAQAPSPAYAEPPVTEPITTHRAERPPVFGTAVAYPGAVPTATGAVPRVGYDPAQGAPMPAPVQSASIPTGHAARVAPISDESAAAERAAFADTGELRRPRGRRSTGEVPAVTAATPVSQASHGQAAQASVPVPPQAAAQPVAPAPAPASAPQPEPARPHTAQPQPVQDPLRDMLTGQMARPATGPIQVQSDDQDDPLALAVRLGLRREGASPESTGSQEVGPTS